MNRLEMESLGQSAESLGIEELLQLISKEYGSQAVFSSSLGQEDQVLTDLILKASLGIEIFTLDTGRLFPETYNLLDKTNLHYNTRIKVYFPKAESVQDYMMTKGVNAFYESIENRKLCCHIRKIEPLQRALKGKKIWITGLRAAQSPNRNNMPFVEWDDNYRIIKINPLLNWTLDEVEGYLNDHNVPQNPLHKKGFVSIGCQPCTRAVQQGEDLRAGRWWWEQEYKKECGLHLKNS